MSKNNRLGQQRKTRTRSSINVSDDRPRLSVNRSNKYIYAQLVSLGGKTLASAKGNSTIEGATKVGGEIAKNAKKKKVQKIVFDRGEYKYHGKVKALAESARKGGLEF